MLQPNRHHNPLDLLRELPRLRGAFAGKAAFLLVSLRRRLSRLCRSAKRAVIPSYQMPPHQPPAFHIGAVIGDNGPGSCTCQVLFPRYSGAIRAVTGMKLTAGQLELGQRALSLNLPRILRRPAAQSHSTHRLRCRRCQVCMCVCPRACGRRS